MKTTAGMTGLLTTAFALLLAAGAAGAAMEGGPAMEDTHGMESQNDTMMHDNDSMMKDHEAMKDDGMEKDDGDDNPLPGFAAVAALVAVGAAAWLSRRRS